MKDGIHPKYQDCVVTCGCGNSFKTRSTKPKIAVEVIVIDNASSDGAADMVEREFPEVVLHRNASNVGFARANNQAAELARGRFLFFLNAAGLSFIGLGVRPPTAEWGIMVAEGASFIVSGEWWVALFPGLVLMAAVFCFNLMGDGLRDIVDPQRRT